MNGSVPLYDIFLHIRKGPSPIRAGSIEEAVEAAVSMLPLEPFQVTDGQGTVLMDEIQLKEKNAEIGGYE